MKKFVYQVKNFEFPDTAAFGQAWQEAKAKATELHVPIFRLVIDGDTVKQQVYYNGGLFNSIEFMNGSNVKVF